MPSLVALKLNSIQEYIFHSNLLKENIGASHVTNEILFNKVLRNFLYAKFKEALAWDDWKSEPGTLKILKEDCKCEVLEIGGGGVMMLFKSDMDGTEFIRNFSLEILQQFPGLKTSFAILKEFDADQNFKEIKNELFKKLESQNKNGLYASMPTKLGVMQNCELSNYSAEVPFSKTDSEKPKKISAHSNIKIKNAGDSDKYYSKLINNDKYTMTTEIELIGKNQEAGYMAVVHIDGNSVGARVSGINSIAELREFSQKRAQLVVDSMKDLVTDSIICKVEDKKIKLPQDEEGRAILPIRPLLNGGDDVTFICEGRWGIYLAEEFLRHFTANKTLIASACAGVAIVKTKFPFYKAYNLAEELCAEAKSVSRGTGNSFLSYFYAATTFSGSLAQIRTRTHVTPDGKHLYFGPYSTDISQPNMHDLKNGIMHFKNPEKITKNKVMKLREILNAETSGKDLFMKELKEQGFSLPGERTHIWEGKDKKNTRFFDQIELMDFYPDELL